MITGCLAIFYLKDKYLIVSPQWYSQAVQIKYVFEVCHKQLQTHDRKIISQNQVSNSSL